jgi:hypothetical protein
MNVLTINDDLKVAIEWAFELAYDDQENYLKSANWQQDYGVDWPDIAEMKATMLDRLAVVVRQLGLEQFAASYESLAEQFRTSAKEEVSDGSK